MKKFILIIFLVYSTNLFSQKTDTAKVIVYDAFNANQTVNLKKDLVYEKNIIKWNLSMLGRGAFEMDYERCISDKLTFEVGAGLTYIDFIREVSANSDDFTFENTKFKYGPLLTADLKFYPKTVLGFEGMYVSIPIRYRGYSSDKEITYNILNLYGIDQNVTSTFHNNAQHFEYGFIVGSQTGNYWDLTWDYFFGVGLNSMTLNQPVFDDNQVPSQVSEHRTRPIIFFGFKLGLPF